eukprot:GHVT01086127.1.p1 GENE.GHVT01086127.1~~GHVT01086127.1.p1  ORF type:complete len:290 (+),score=47.31 GHVT01086127.1:62-871(+)
MSPLHRFIPLAIVALLLVATSARGGDPETDASATAAEGPNAAENSDKAVPADAPASPDVQPMTAENSAPGATLKDVVIDPRVPLEDGIYVFKDNLYQLNQDEAGTWLGKQIGMVGSPKKPNVIKLNDKGQMSDKNIRPATKREVYSGLGKIAPKIQAIGELDALASELEAEEENKQLPEPVVPTPPPSHPAKILVPVALVTALVSGLVSTLIFRSYYKSKEKKANAAAEAKLNEIKAAVSRKASAAIGSRHTTAIGSRRTGSRRTTIKS